MKLVRWDPLQELIAVSDRPNRTVDHSYSTRTEDSFGPWAVDFLERQHHDAGTAKLKTVEIKAA